MIRRVKLIGIALGLCVTGLGGMVLWSTLKPRDDRTAMPAPTEIVEQKAAKKRLRKEREAWIESLHHAAPGTDWRAMEMTTRRAHILEREAMVSQGRGTSAWTELGSANQAGRTHATAISANTGALYVGSDLGGVWKGNIEGTSWTPISDGIGLGSHQLMVAPGPPEVITTSTNGGIIHASTNDGASWFVPAGLPDRRVYTCYRMLGDPVDPHTVYLLLRGGRTNGGVEYANFLLRSFDGGQSYQVVHTEPYAERCDMWMDRVNGGPLYLMSGGTVKRSVDQGETFTIVGAVPASVSEVVLAGSEAGAPTLYAGVNTGTWELWRSLDGGATWEYRYAIHDWWRTLCASITNPDLVLFAGVEAWRSLNGGTTFTKVNNWWDYYGDPLNRLHADNPGMECVMVDAQETWFLNTDGGTYTSTDGVASVQNISLHGLGISQYYSVFTSQTNPYLVVAGAQDQGYQQSLPITAPYLEFDQLISGDYGHLTSTVRDHNLLYSVYPGFVLIQKYETTGGLLQLDFPEGESHSWMPNILADPHDPGIFYLCARHIHTYRRTGENTWFRTQQNQDFAAGGGSFLTALAISSFNRNYWYGVTDSGVLWYSHNEGGTWTVSPDTGPQAHYFYGTDIIVSPTDPTHAFVGGSGYNGPAVYETVDGGQSWSPMSDGLPGTLVFQLAFDNPTDQNLYAAAEAGPYAYDSGTGQWSAILGTEAPLTVYWSVEGVPELDVVRFGTYGRGIWDFSPDDVVAVGDGESGPAVANRDIRIVPNPAREAATFAFDVGREGRVRVEVYDVAGRRVAVAFDGVVGSGRTEVRFDLDGDAGGPLPNGMFLVRAITPDGVRVQKLRVLR